MIDGIGTNPTFYVISHMECKKGENEVFLLLVNFFNAFFKIETVSAHWMEANFTPIF